MRSETAQKKIGIVGKFMLERREQLGLSRSELAKLIGCKGPNMICMLEHGRASFPFRRWQIYADALQVPRHEFLRLAFQEVFPSVLPFIDFVKGHRDSEKDPPAAPLSQESMAIENGKR